MISRIYPGAEGYEFFQGLSLLLFVLVFLGVVYVAVTMRRSHSDKMSHMPLDLDEDKPMHHGGHE